MKEKVIAVVGASKDPEKYGNKVLNNLKGKGFNVIPINPHENEIEGLKAFHSLSEAGQQIDLVVFVVPPEAALKVLKEVKSLNINEVWMQPGSESEKAVQFCKDNNIRCTYNACIMVKTDE